MKFNFTINATKWNQQVAALQKVVGQDAQTIIRDEGRKLMTTAIRLTPPKSLAQGRNAIRQDLLGGRNIGATGAKKSRGIFFVLQDWMPQGISERTVRLFARKTGEVYGADMEHYRPNASMGELKAHHLANRSRRTGRTTLAGNYTKDVGRWKFVNQMVVKKAAMNRYLKTVYARSGFMKAGFLPALMALGGRAAGWISRHTSPAGFVVNDLDNPSFPSITYGNRTRGIGQIRRAFQAAVDIRANAIGNRIKLILSGYSKDVAQGIRVSRKAKETGGGVVE